MTTFCQHCDEPMPPGESESLHYECLCRIVVGSAAHQLRKCTCFGGAGEDPPEMTKREAARLALETWRMKLMDWKSPLRNDLADATDLVWQMQHALTGDDDVATPELLRMAEDLKYRADVILGCVARLELLRKER